MTGVQTCALPISGNKDLDKQLKALLDEALAPLRQLDARAAQIIAGQLPAPGASPATPVTQPAAGAPSPSRAGEPEAGVFHPDGYHVDPQLRAIFKSYNDESAPRDQVVDLLKRYIADHPDSIFLPELYFRIGALYSMHHHGAAFNAQLEIEYFQKSHELWGTRYCILNMVAWNNYLARSGRPYEPSKEYYQWLLKVKHVSVDDLYPIRDIEATFNGRLPELSWDEKRVVAANAPRLVGGGRNDTGAIAPFERSFLKRYEQEPDKLADMAKSFPDTDLGKAAAAQLRALESSAGRPRGIP